MVGRLRFHASWKILPGEPIVVSVIHVQDVRVLLPPGEERPHLSVSGVPPGSKPDARDGASPAADQANTGETSASNARFFKMPRVIIEKVECQQAELEIERKQDAGKPPKVPLDFELKNVELTPDGHGGPVAFVVDMVNAKPVGLITRPGILGRGFRGTPERCQSMGTTASITLILALSKVLQAFYRRPAITKGRCGGSRPMVRRKRLTSALSV